jgi:adenylate cyclase
MTHIQSLHFLKDYILWQFIMMSTIAAFMINDKYGPGNLRSFLMGRYFRPVREERIFMFLDLRSSTYIAQVLGEQQYFNFIKDVIQDATPVILKHKGRIYQYVGDEITVSWRMHQGPDRLNCIRCPMEVRRVFNHRSSYYTARYGVVPDFKAGLHYGNVMVGEIGVVKRDIAFSGEVVGTAARIQAKCNHYEVNLLISEDLKNILTWEGSNLEPAYVGDLSMKGKAADLPLYTLNSVKTAKAK